MIKIILNNLSINSYSYLVLNRIFRKSKILFIPVRLIILIWDFIIGIPISIYYYLKVLNTSPKEKIAIVAIAKNESEYIEEWVAFHKAIGFDTIILYDNDSTDGMTGKIMKYVDEGFIILNRISGIKQQYNAYNHAIKQYKHEYKYMAFIDCDEFILPINNGENIKEILDKQFKNKCFAGGIGVNWCMYGSSGHLTKPKGLLIDNFVYRSKITGKGNNCIKTIAKPECIYKFNHPHFPLYKSFYYNINFKGLYIPYWENIINEYVGLRINHYFTKSKEQWIKRRALGMADCGPNSKRTLDEFYEHDNNDILDPLATYYSDKVKNLIISHNV